MIPQPIDYEASLKKSIMAVRGYAGESAHFITHHPLEAEKMNSSRNYWDNGSIGEGPSCESMKRCI